MKNPYTPGDIRINHVRLRVRDIASVEDFYRQVLGLVVLRKEGAETSFAAPGKSEPLLILAGDPTALVHRYPMTGLFHVAFRFPTRRDLAHAVQRLIQNQYPIEGASDHLVSEAIYLSDPEGNGIELYADLPREKWAWRAGEVSMSTEPLDLRGLLATAGDDLPPLQAAGGTDVGHIHLQTADLSGSRHFFNAFLGLDITSSSYPGALFFSAEGYHHHIGTNIWGRRTTFPPEGSTGLVSYRIEVSDAEFVSSLHDNAQTFGLEVRTSKLSQGRDLLQVRDPSGTWLEVRERRETLNND